MATLVDTNILLDLATDDPHWADWSLRQLEAAAVQGPLLINDVIYAELSVRFPGVEQVNAFVAEAGLHLEPLTRPALFLAGKVFKAYRGRGGSRSGVLPDFLIGAQAAVMGLPLLTRDAARYRSDFPTVTLIVPDQP
ncbi:type II toxin-antitoxin system VapC family toxin [Teichococcus oryzae]|uniref:Type II toxin-antitoxin system VapC family toxin n=1 Tax=Teichococcus oryzae TaxID=1608942 RepID=A0A5B2TI46_9PROT|nr:type II toxin-antitoxin system VapC family toxin [Pseudoroseomonas oryzae]KAA2213608.1 type II toxin-antitoxin system VapC family toxin [Pseudoroseomonas oryzae]